jgi:hypothetical protein
VPLHLHQLDLREALHHVHHRVQHLVGLALDRGLVRVEVDPVQDDDRLEAPVRAGLDRGQRLVGAAVGVLEAVERLGLDGAGVVHVQDAVAVVVGVRAAVGVFEAVLVLGVHRAAVVPIQDAVGVVVARLHGVRFWRAYRTKDEQASRVESDLAMRASLAVVVVLLA